MAERVKEWTREWERQGMLKGLEEGLQEGRQEREAALLKELLSCKFGPLPPQIERRLDEASSQDLLGWAERVPFAETNDQVIED